MKEFWDARYVTDEYVYGKKPNEFFKECIDNINHTGKILLPAEGEGRNAVYAAKKGFDVYAFDISSEGKNKALLLAQSEKVQIQYEVGMVNDLQLIHESFDIAALTFAHMPPILRSDFHRNVSMLIKPNGLIILEGFSKNNLDNRIKNPSIGGPDKLEMLFSPQDIEADFSEFEIIKLEECEVELNEGSLHIGLAKVVRFIGKKRC